jgi:hypothetical protein
MCFDFFPQVVSETFLRLVIGVYLIQLPSVSRILHRESGQTSVWEPCATVYHEHSEREEERQIYACRERWNFKVTDRIQFSLFAREMVPYWLSVSDNKIRFYINITADVVDNTFKHVCTRTPSIKPLLDLCLVAASDLISLSGFHTLCNTVFSKGVIIIDV